MLTACTGHGRCYTLAPDVFIADDDGHCVVIPTGEVPAEHESQARNGVANCPETRASRGRMRSAMRP